MSGTKGRREGPGPGDGVRRNRRRGAGPLVQIRIVGLVHNFRATHIIPQQRTRARIMIPACAELSHSQRPRRRAPAGAAETRAHVVPVPRPPVRIPKRYQTRNARHLIITGIPRAANRQRLTGLREPEKFLAPTAAAFRGHAL